MVYVDIFVTAVWSGADRNNRSLYFSSNFLKHSLFLKRLPPHLSLLNLALLYNS